MGQLQLTDWLLFNALMASLALLSNGRIRAVLVRVLGPWVRTALRRLSLVADTDGGPGELWTAMYRQRLVGHVERLRRAVATDELLSATRQIGNRIALARLLRDLDELPAADLLPDLFPVLQADRPIESWSSVAMPVVPPVRDRSWLPAPRYAAEPVFFGARADGGLPQGDTRSRSRVEVLEIGWGH